MRVNGCSAPAREGRDARSVGAPLFRSARAALLAALLGLLLVPGLPCGRAEAHSVYIFAWPESGRICTESYFSRSAKVRGGEVLMLDGQGAELAAGRTDNAGGICFPAPDIAMDLHFVVKAGQGHRAEYLLPASSVAEAVRGKDAGKAAVPVQESVIPEAATPSAGAGSLPGDSLATSPDTGQTSVAAVSSSGTPDMEAWRAVLREELALQLAPLHRALAAQQEQSGPGLRDIIGGLGWIAGLAGLGVFYAGRRKKG